MKISYPAFSSKPQNLVLKHEEIHVWCASLDQPVSRFQMLSQTLSPDEHMRAERFHFEKDRNHFIISHGILRTILGSYLSVEPDKLQFCYGKYGKPALADISGNGRICFNSSRSEWRALYVFTLDREIGVDIEHIHDISEMDQIVERFFSVTENEVFHALPESKKKEAFFNCWTRKEAVIKAIGDGLYCPLDKFDVSLSPGEPADLLSIEGDSIKASGWYIQDLSPDSEFAAACAVEGLCQFRWYQWSA
ncbi:4'-phosphopantetheinyl transferase sfp [bacterium BMS3Abin10]|nr:4'-phosphopantetheinyl transferase sfp [bacterium BMS3Abin10]GBE37513.1 4'-phosphopantetheinyl transferase sfp [bacterium BMS3Bbin08]